MKFKPWEVAKLTPFQVKHCLLVERDKKGMVSLDPPMGGPPPEMTLASEMADYLRKRGITDPVAMRRLVERLIADDPYSKPPETEPDDEE